MCAMVSSSPATSHLLPVYATSFVGRHSEISDLASELENSDCRLLTLTGFGGIGKTRLAIEAVSLFANGDHSARQQSFPDGLYFVALAPLSSSDLLAATIADTLDIPVSGAKPVRDQLLEKLAQKSMLLLLDNFEHLMDGKQLVNDILEFSPHVKMIVTSREPLSLPGETVYDLQGMAIPSTDTDEVPQIEEYSALLLFEQVAQKVDWRFSVDDEQLPHVIRICRLVEGLPLAIEMAASWARVLSCRQIAEELSQSYALLKATLGHIPTRHQSIRVVFDYSWQLLTEDEQLVFQKMAVFRGGFRRDAAEQITGATLDVLLSLVDKSLLQYDAHERYHIHELLRQFAEEKLAQNSERARETHDRHCVYYAEFLGEREKEFVEYDIAAPVVETIHADIDNVREMWDWAIARRHFQAIELAANSLYHYFRIRETWRESTAMFQNAVGVVETSGQDVLLAKLLGMLTIHATFCDFYDLGQKAAQQGLGMAQALDLPVAEARCLDTLGNSAIVRGDYHEARQYLADCVDRFSVLDETYEAQFARLRLGYAYHQSGDFDRARECYHQLIFSGHQRKTNGLAAWGLDHLGHLENSLENYAAGRQHFADAVAIFKSFGWAMGVFSASRGLADAYTGLGQYDEARHHYYIALTASADHGPPTGILAMLTLLGIAHLLAQEGDVARAIELTAFLRQYPQASNETRTLASKLLNELRVEVAPIIFKSAQERGATLEIETLVTDFVEEFRTSDENHILPPEAVSEYELDLLHQVTESLANGGLFDENLSEKERASVRSLVDTVDAILEQEKAKIMATFMASASHDLRSPLTIINTSLYLLERISDSDAQQGQLQTVKDQVSHLQTLIEDLITMARLDGGTTFDKKRHNLNQLVAVIQHTHTSSLTSGRRLDIDFSFCDGPLLIQADEDKLQQALLNIMTNAVQYTPDDGAVSIKLYSETGEAIIAVSDTGKGIDVEDLPHIFERFYRGDEARTERGRSGLGLAIAQKIIEAHDGKIDVVSAPDAGSTFRIMLPTIKQ